MDKVGGRLAIQLCLSRELCEAPEKGHPRENQDLETTVEFSKLNFKSLAK